MPIYPYSFQLPPLNVQDIPNDGAVGEFLGISAGGVLDWLPVATGGGDMLKSENLSGLADYSIARTNIGLGTASTPQFANLTIDSLSLSSSAPVTISQTWGTTGTYTAAKVNITETATANPLSKLLDLQLGGVSKLSFRKDGWLIFGSTLCAIRNYGDNLTLGNTVSFLATLVCDTGIEAGGFKVSANGFLGFSYTAGSNNVGDVRLYRDGATTLNAGQLALRNGANAQTFNVYGTYTPSPLAYERLTISATGGLSGNAIIGTNKTGTGVLVRGLEFQTDGVTRMTIASGGAITTSVAFTCTQITVGGGSYLFHGSQAAIGSSGNGRHLLLDSGGTFYDRLQIGGTSASFPAIKRVGAELQIVIASTSAAAGVAAADADLTFIEDRYRRKGAGTPEGVVTAPIGAVYHNTTGGAGTSFYVKESGTGNTGWVGK